MMPRISSSEWEVMSVVWSREPLTAAEVFERLPSGHGWKQKTVNTFLTRLVSKGILEADKKGKAFLYSSTVAKEKCIQVESDSFLKRVFQGATGELMLHFCERADLTPDEIKELEQLLRAKKGRK